ncbi:hypothetical protein HX862_28680 [Pseudomonas sp. D5002]|uniref:hypothetical protein n=1 Tax=Pseudomonas sp. D5002 TaxID=2738818 RepID=UPI0015A038C8|nr:hypothetical protein [Pseudomonas sp. D5002]NWB11917.1 hypothetical protein [Pseudomonas sp. D5002]
MAMIQVGFDRVADNGNRWLSNTRCSWGANRCALATSSAFSADPLQHGRGLQIRHGPLDGFALGDFEVLGIGVEMPAGHDEHLLITEIDSAAHASPGMIDAPQ